MIVRNFLRYEEENSEPDIKKKEEVKDPHKLTSEQKNRQAHFQREADKFAPTKKLNSNYMNVSGISPISCRHEIDLYGTKSGIGKFNPIMVENVYQRPPESLFDKPVNKKINAKSITPKKDGQKSAEKSAEKKPFIKPSKLNKENSTTKPSKAKLVLTNQNKSKPDYNKQFTLPGSFDTLYG